jgi:hypothetical protein
VTRQFSAKWNELRTTTDSLLHATALEDLWMRRCDGWVRVRNRGGKYFDFWKYSWSVLRKLYCKWELGMPRLEQALPKTVSPAWEKTMVKISSWNIYQMCSCSFPCLSRLK